MTAFSEILLLIGLVFGHLALWVALFNRLHACSLPRSIAKIGEKLVILVLAGGPIAGTWWLLARGGLTGAFAAFTSSPWLLPYAVLCGAAGVFVVARWMETRARPSAPPQLVCNHTTALDVAEAVPGTLACDRLTRLLALVPGNEAFRLNVHEKTLTHPRLPGALDGLSIGHLSDLHFTGGISLDYFRYVVDRANELDVDLMFITGDIADKAACLEWIPETLGRLSSRCGSFFVLGNHDKRLPDVARLRRVLVEAGIRDLGGRCTRLDLFGEPLLLAGNELPWFGPAPGESAIEAEAGGGDTFKILLAHTPDQVSWAKAYGFDLMLAGHTHGGQIRLPGIGPIVAPSYHGVKYASGVFFEPPTLMHVSRGIAGLDPIRIGCPPELAKLTLRKEQA